MLQGSVVCNRLLTDFSSWLWFSLMKTTQAQSTFLIMKLNWNKQKKIYKTGATKLRRAWRSSWCVLAKLHRLKATYQSLLSCCRDFSNELLSFKLYLLFTVNSLPKIWFASFILFVLKWNFTSCNYVFLYSIAFEIMLP